MTLEMDKEQFIILLTKLNMVKNAKDILLELQFSATNVIKICSTRFDHSNNIKYHYDDGDNQND